MSPTILSKGPLVAVIDSVLQGLRTGIKEKRTQLRDLWPQIVGSRFSPHTKAILRREGTLYVWVDDSVLASELGKKYSGTLLKRAQEALGEDAVRRIIFRVGQIHPY